MFLCILEMISKYSLCWNMWSCLYPEKYEEIRPWSYYTKKKKVNLKEKVNHGFTNHQAEANTVGCNTWLRVFQLNLDGRLSNKSHFQ